MLREISSSCAAGPTADVEKVCVFADVEERIGVCCVGRGMLSGDVQTDGAGAGRVGMEVARLAVSTERHILMTIVVSDDDARLTDRPRTGVATEHISNTAALISVSGSGRQLTPLHPQEMKI